MKKLVFSIFLVFSIISSTHAFEVCTTSSGSTIKWDSDNTTYYINPAGMPDEGVTAILNALESWTNTPAKFTFIYGGMTNTESGVLDFINTIDFGNLPFYSVGRNTYWFHTATGQLVDSDIRFNSSHSWATNGQAGSYDIETIALHELGHSLCLKDLYALKDSEKVMYGYASKGMLKRTLHEDDINGIIALYGTSTETECTYQIAPEGETFQASGGSGTITVTTPPGCSWTVKTNASWIKIVSSQNGNGPGHIEYSVLTNPSIKQRAGVINISGRTFTVTQEGKPVILVEPRYILFGKSSVGSTLERTITVKNVGRSTLIINSTNISGYNASDFENTSCDTVLPGEACVITVKFKASMPFGRKSATISIFSNDFNRPVINVKLQATVSPPKISVSPRKLNFGNLSTTTEKSITITNRGISDLHITHLAIKDASHMPSDDYTIVGNSCRLHILPGDSCVIILSFTPGGAIGYKNGYLQIFSNDPRISVVTVGLIGRKDI